jgi:hypothetical protein
MGGATAGVAKTPPLGFRPVLRRAVVLRIGLRCPPTFDSSHVTSQKDWRPGV